MADVLPLMSTDSRRRITLQTTSSTLLNTKREDFGKEGVKEKRRDRPFTTPSQKFPIHQNPSFSKTHVTSPPARRIHFTPTLTGPRRHSGWNQRHSSDTARCCCRRSNGWWGRNSTRYASRTGSPQAPSGCLELGVRVKFGFKIGEDRHIVGNII